MIHGRAFTVDTGSPSDMIRELEKAIHHHRAGNLQQAESFYKNILQRHPDSSDALHLLDMVSYQRREYEDVVRDVSK